MHSPVSTSQHRTVPSLLPERANRSSGERTAEFTPSWCPSSSRITFPLARLHIPAVRSSLPISAWVPDEFKTIELIRAAWVIKLWVSQVADRSTRTPFRPILSQT